MIRISCTNCKTILSIDDAFAGGVCRCQHCGTIQTVPAHLKGNATAAAKPTAAAGVGGQPWQGQQQKSLYQDMRRAQQQPAPDRESTRGLEELSDAVLSSGLGRSALRKPGEKEAADPAGPGGIDYASPE